jgi:hypothetical protein
LTATDSCRNLPTASFCASLILCHIYSLLQKEQSKLIKRRSRYTSSLLVMMGLALLTLSNVVDSHGSQCWHVISRRKQPCLTRTCWCTKQTKGDEGRASPEATADCWFNPWFGQKQEFQPSCQVVHQHCGWGRVGCSIMCNVQCARPPALQERNLLCFSVDWLWGDAEDLPRYPCWSCQSRGPTSSVGIFGLCLFCSIPLSHHLNTLLNADFHNHKKAFMDLGICDHFNIPKLYSMMHYLECIGPLDVLMGWTLRAQSACILICQASI